MFSLKNVFSKKIPPPPAAIPAALIPFDWNTFDNVLLMQGESRALPLIMPGFDYSAKINSHDETPLLWALGWGKQAIARRLIECGAPLTSMNDGGETPLTASACRGDTEMVRLLLEKGVGANDSGRGGYSPLSAAALNNKADTMALLIENGAAIEGADDSGQTPLMRAASASQGDGEALRLLLGHKPALDTVDKNGKTALIHGVIGQKLSVVQGLLDAGAAMDIQDDKGETALYIACSYIRGADNAQALLKAGADPNLANKEGRTPLMWAAIGDQQDATVSALLARGAAPDARDNNGQTALIWATNRGKKDAVRKLLEAGADPRLRTPGGQSARDYAAAVKLVNADNAGAAAGEIETMLKAAEEKWALREPVAPAPQARTPGNDPAPALERDITVPHLLQLKRRVAAPASR